MKKNLLLGFKWLLTKLGKRLSERRLHGLQMVLNYMKLGRWMAENGFEVGARSPTRRGVFAAVAERVRSGPVLYLEFGVFEGKSMRYWSEALEHPDALLHGFDSFEGLPENFDVGGPYVKGSFDVGGEVPVIDDSRVSFFKGWFEDVLPSYEVPEHDLLIVNIDADLYSSTTYVLNFLERHIRPGTFIYFDDLSRLDHEPRAFVEFMTRTGRRFRLVRADRSLNRAFFECVSAGTSQ